MYYLKNHSRMKIWGEYALGVAEGASSETSMNLSGKQTHIGRNSGERHVGGHRRGKLQLWREVILSGARTENLIQGILLSFFCTYTADERGGIVLLKRTPLFDAYATYGAKTIDFGGWELPVQFSSIKEEHEAVRTKAGLFDVSHMGEIFVEGVDATAYLQHLLSNDISKIAINQAQYNAMLYAEGGVVDDLLVYKLDESRYLLCVNAANIEKDFDWMNAQAANFDVTITNESANYAQIALQGPLAQDVLQRFTETDLQTINPALAKEWNYKKNEGLTPADVRPGSDKKVWWKCAKGHKWQASILNRTIGHGCPYCCNQLVAKGYNDLATTRPQLTTEWDFNKNKAITPEEVTFGSDKKVWWLCKKGHSW